MLIWRKINEQPRAYLFSQDWLKPGFILPSRTLGEMEIMKLAGQNNLAQGRERKGQPAATGEVFPQD